MVQFAYDSLKKMVWSGYLELPSERALAHRLGVCRNVIRSAIGKLTSEGIMPPVVGKRRRIISWQTKKNDRPLDIGIVTQTMGPDPAMPEVARTKLRKLIGNDKHNIITLDLNVRGVMNRRDKRLTIRPIDLDGVIAVSVWDDRILAWLESLACPVVLFDHLTPSRRIIDLLPDETGGCMKIARLFARRKIQAVLYVDFIDENWNPVRWNSFVAAMTSCRLQIKDRFFVESMPVNREGLRKTLTKLEKGVAIFCVNNLVGRLVSEAVERIGRRSPEDNPVVVVSEEDVKFPGDRLATRYSLDWEKGAQMAYAMLKQLMAGWSIRRKRRYFPIRIHHGQTL